MTTRVFSRLLRTGVAFAASAAMLATGALTASPAQAVGQPLMLTASPQVSSVAAFGDASIDISWIGCILPTLKLEEQTASGWATVGLGTAMAGKLGPTCDHETSTDTVGLLDLLGNDYQNGTLALSPGVHTLRLYGMSNIGNTGTSSPFQLTVVRALTSFTGWSNQTITVKPGGSFTLPALTLANPGGYNNLVIPEIDQGFGWICLTSRCDGNRVAYNETLNFPAHTIKVGKDWNLQTRFRYHVLVSDYVGGAYSPTITVKFTRGIAKSKATKTLVKVSGTQVYGKSQATLKATVSSSKATGVVGFSLYKHTAYGAYERVYSPKRGPVVSHGRASYKFSNKVAPKGSYIVVANFQSKNPKKYLDSIKLTSFTVK